MRSAVITALILCSLLGVWPRNAHAEITFEWSELPETPVPSGTLDVAGPFIGISNDVLIVAGGVTSPDQSSESNKVWHDDIYVLVRDSNADETYRWITGQKLERPIAYGARKRNRSSRSRCRVSPNRWQMRVLRSLATPST
jgi:hypothetical protein